MMTTTDERPTWQVIEDRDRVDAREERMRTLRLFGLCAVSAAVIGLAIWLLG